MPEYPINPKTVLSGIYKSNNNSERKYLSIEMVHGNKRSYIDLRDPWGALLYAYRLVLGYVGDTIIQRQSFNFNAYNKSMEEFVLQFWKYLKFLN